MKSPSSNLSPAPTKSLRNALFRISALRTEQNTFPSIIAVMSTFFKDITFISHQKTDNIFRIPRFQQPLPAITTDISPFITKAWLASVYRCAEKSEDRQQ